jgi:hypothetical protein
VIVEYTRPVPFNGQPRAHFQQMAQGLRASKVIDLNGRAALVIRQDSDQTRHNFGVVIFKLNGNEIRVMGHDDQATLEALALSMLNQSAGSRGSAGSRHHATSLPGLTATKLVRLETIVRGAARADGDAHPSSATVFASRRHEANIAGGAGSGVPGNQPVYLVIIRGHFVCNDCSGPANAVPPRGNVIMMVLDRWTLRGLDGGHRRARGHEQRRSRPATPARPSLIRSPGTKRHPLQVR